MNIEEAIDNLLMLKYFIEQEKENNYKEYITAIQTVLNELDNKEKIIDILLNEAAKEGTPSEFEYRKKRILEICKEKVEDK